MSKLQELDDATLVQFYIALRDRRAKRKAAYESDDAEDKRKQDKIDAEFLARFNARGIDTVSVRGIGTAYRTTRTSCPVADNDAFFSWVAGDFDERRVFLEARANKTAVKQYIEEHGDLPPGVNWSATQAVNFNRA
jgi:hypothetical protein